MSKNNLNVFTYGYLPLTYWKNWFSNIGQFFRNIKYAYQRITRGYCDFDIWSLESFYSELFYQTLTELSKEAHGYPGKMALDGKSFEDWQRYLTDMAKHFKNTQEWDEYNFMNVYVMEAYDKMQSYVKNEDIISFYKDVENEDNYTDKIKYEEAKEMWLDMEKKAAQYRNDEKNIAFDMMKDVFFDLWD